MSYIKIYSIILISIVLILPSRVSAQQNPTPTEMIRISPVIFNISLSPGKTYTYQATVENLLSVPLPVDLQLHDFQTTDEEGGVAFTESRNDPLLSWITLSENTLLLPPRAKRTIRMTVSLPQRIPVGGYYGMLYFAPRLPQYANEQTLISAKVGTLLLANIGVPNSKQKKADIVDFSFTNPYFETEKISFMLRVKNTALQHFTAKPILKVTSLLGNQTSYPLVEKFVFPGKIRRWNEQVTLRTTQPGIYKATMVIATGNGEQVNTEKYFIIFPLMKFILTSIILLLILLVIFKRKQIKKALHILIKG